MQNFASPALPSAYCFFLANVISNKVFITLLNNNVCVTSRLRCMWQPVGGCIDLKNKACALSLPAP